MGAPYTGGCACGAIRYECLAEPLFSWKCHCRDCQRYSGAGGGIYAVFLTSSVRFLKGEPKYHVVKGASGNNTSRGFCPECGSPTAVKTELFPGICAASIDDPTWVRLVADIWTASAQPWDVMAQSSPKFVGTPTAEEVEKLVQAATGH